MPPKSSAKKELILWYLCEKCKVNITSKDRDKHEDYCPIVTHPGEPFICSFVYDNKFYSTTLNPDPPTDCLISNLPANQLNGYVFIRESVMNLCGFILGDWVVCTSPQLPHTQVVRSIWPVPDRFLTTVYVTVEGKTVPLYHQIIDNFFF